MLNQLQDLNQDEKEMDVRQKIIGIILTIILICVITLMIIAIYTFIQIKMIHKSFTFRTISSVFSSLPKDPWSARPCPCAISNSPLS